MAAAMADIMVPPIVAAAVTEPKDKFQFTDMGATAAERITGIATSGMLYRTCLDIIAGVTRTRPNPAGIDARCVATCNSIIIFTHLCAAYDIAGTIQEGVVSGWAVAVCHRAREGAAWKRCRVKRAGLTAGLESLFARRLPTRVGRAKKRDSRSNEGTRMKEVENAVN